MEVAGKRQTKAAYSASRVYSPTRGANAYAYAPAAAPVEQPHAPAPQPQKAPRPKPKQRPALSMGCRAAMLLGIAAVAAACLFVVSRYSRIAGEYLVVNDLKTKIEETQLRVRTLNVELECAVSLQNVQDAAARLGMTYPKADQYVRVGDALPAVAGAGTAAEANNGTAEGA